MNKIICLLLVILTMSACSSTQTQTSTKSDPVSSTSSIESLPSSEEVSSTPKLTKVIFKVDSDDIDTADLMSAFLDTPYLIMCLNAQNQIEVDIEVINTISGSTIEKIHYPDANQIRVFDKLGDYEAAIKGAQISKDFEGSDALIVSIDFTNSSKETVMSDVALLIKAFQNGVQLDSTYVSSEFYENSMKEIRPGTTIEIEKAYMLDDLEHEVEVEVSELISLSNENIIKTFNITQLD